jgi:hypothetical protein
MVISMKPTGIYSGTHHGNCEDSLCDLDHRGLPSPTMSAPGGDLTLPFSILDTDLYKVDAASSQLQSLGVDQTALPADHAADCFTPLS